MERRIRLICDPPRPAALNMAVDEVLMESQSHPGAIPVLRFYTWEMPAYSAGYFQNVSQLASRLGAKERNIPLVRRITGGGLVFHGTDLTFSLSLKNPSPYLPADVKSSYLKINEALRAGLSRSYPKLDYADCRTVPSGRVKGERICFDQPSCYDLLLEGRKVVGASQRRRAGALLHQSAIFLDAPPEDLVVLILEGFREKWKTKFLEMPLTGEERSLAECKGAERYGQDDWAFDPLARCARTDSFFS